MSLEDYIMVTKHKVGAIIGSTPRELANDSFFTAVRTGATSAIYAEKHKREQKASYITSFVDMGFTIEEAEKMYAGE